MTEIMLTDTGYREDEFDHKDLYYRAPANIQPAKEVNLRKLYKADFGSVYNQGSINSCVANSATACYWFEEKANRRPEVWGSAGPSRLFVYWLLRGGYAKADHEIAKGARDNGGHPRAAMKGISKCGVCVESDWPYPDEDHIKKQIKHDQPKLSNDALTQAVEAEVQRIVNTKPSADAFTRAAPHNQAYYYRLDPLRPDKDKKHLSKGAKDDIGDTLLLDLRKCLTEGYPVSFAFKYCIELEDLFQHKAHDYWVLTDEWDPKGLNFPRHATRQDLPEKYQKLGGAHSVLAIGYDDKAGPGHKGAVLCQNSWGPKWSKDGLFWMPYIWITDFYATNDFWTIRSHKIPGPPLFWKEVHDSTLPAA